ncbi:hypothetical protein HHK36_031839 [Tetracentron sinense]|uniref:Cupin type-1 domain-containing protein n=1 Tax=Tetracentron sinense TaxID=13715 RepID=A0A834YBE2_TETSI|nr:hypothetical protein HHK36_031839 [Tetracentron sinense]
MEDYTHLQDFDEADDALSLCDLPLYSDGTEWEDSGKEYPRPSSSDHEFFEFSSDFSGEMNMIIPPPNDIIFCGKLIPYKESPTEDRAMRKSPSLKKQLQKLRNPSKKCDLTARKESILSSSVKPRWYLLMFGLVKFPTEMELKDIRNRQSRRNPSSLFPAFDGGKSVKGIRSRGKGSFWGLLRAFGCKSHANAMVKASFGCIPQLEQPQWQGQGQQQQQQKPRPFRGQSECRIESLSALEPSRLIESEAGVTEFWDENNEQLDCTGVAAVRYVIQPRGLLLPSFHNAPRLSYIVQGRLALISHTRHGVIGHACRPTYTRDPSTVQTCQDEAGHYKPIEFS